MNWVTSGISTEHFGCDLTSNPVITLATFACGSQVLDCMKFNSPNQSGQEARFLMGFTAESAPHRA
jgi:hypothetical protein